MAEPLAAHVRPALRVILAAPRGFCAGVERAIAAVEDALTRFGAPVYVRRPIVHNRTVMRALEAKGAVFVEELGEVPPGAIVLLSAHGVAPAVAEEARKRALTAYDAVCPLVAKVHREVVRHHRGGRHVLLIGHHGHPEVIGTLGQLPPGAITLIETLEDAARFSPRDPARLAYVTQTTLSVDDTAAIIAVLKKRFAGIVGPHRQDICYATTNRQDAVKRVAPAVDAMIVVGSPNSSNSRRLAEVALRAGCRCAALLERAQDLDWRCFARLRALGLTAGASAPEVLVEEILDAFAQRYRLDVQTVTAAHEAMFFPLPRPLRSNEAAV